ncbi:hypothetical protein MNBD_ALPHA08-300 [hydrothermal vent metagenome]|uniref:Inner membrane protein YjeT (Clustered with HflC) n=1 Tax=hydrothermal vent metagenome TaxID=652676 RepID=A0A3B1ARK5_9ZZZZ
MLADLVAAIGLVFVIEGLLFAIAPDRLKSMLSVVEATPKETLRTLGVVAIAIGVFIVWLAS